MGALLALDSIFLPIGSCGSLEMDAQCLLSRFDSSLGEGIVFLFVAFASRVSGESVYVLLRFRVSLRNLGGIGFVWNGAENLFLFCLLFVSDIIIYFL